METTVVVLDATTGARVGDPERRYGKNWRTRDDLLVLEGTAYDLIRLANVMERRARTPGYQSNTTLRMARELRNAAGALLPYPAAEAVHHVADAAFAARAAAEAARSDAEAAYAPAPAPAQWSAVTRRLT